MQLVMHNLWVAFVSNPGLFLGSVLVGLLILYAATLWLGTLQRLNFQRQQRSLERERLRFAIKAAKIQCKEAEQIKDVWSGYRKFQVVKKERECDGVESFYLAAHDGRALPPFKPGQYLTFQLNVPGADKPVVRCYSLSDSPVRKDYYRVTIKNVCAAPDQPESKPGVASCHFCDRIQMGEILDVKAPNGHFFLDMSEESPVVLISGGVGITPMLSMLNAVIESGSKREVWFFHGARSSADHIQKAHVEKAAAEHDNVRLHICYSRPEPADVLGRDYQHAGRLTIDLLKQVLPSNNYDYFLCGPGPMMTGVTDGLAAWGVPKKSVHFEAFGPATVKEKTPMPTASETSMLKRLRVTFGRSNKTVQWNPESSSLLDFAEANGIRIESGCRAGSCGSCLVAVKSGEVDYVVPPEALPEDRSCLTCICKPKGDLVLDA
jgi:ferredoxin-NADP reductase